MKTAPPSAPTLSELQRWMAALIWDGKRLDALLQDRDEVGALIIAPSRGTTLERLRVYANGYPVRVQESLAQTYPAVAHVIGEAAFRNLVERFVEANPLRSYNLNDAGAELPRFLQQDTLSAHLPFLPDLARLEWQVVRAFHAADHPQLDPTPLSTWTHDDWERVVLRFQPWVGLVVSDWPVREIWECREMPVEEIDIDLRDRSDRVLVRRSGYAVVCESVEDTEAVALGALLDGQVLGDVLATLAARGDDAARVAAWFARWTALRLISRCAPASAA